MYYRRSTVALAGAWAAVPLILGLIWREMVTTLWRVAILGLCLQRHNALGLHPSTGASVEDDAM